RQGHAEQAQQTVTEEIEEPVQKHHDKNEAYRHDDGQALLGLLQGLKFSCPLDAVPVRKLHVTCDLFLGFGDGPAKIAITDAEFHGDETLVVFVINVEAPGSRDMVASLVQGI